jgi:hypothetical protein
MIWNTGRISSQLIAAPRAGTDLLTSRRGFQPAGPDRAAQEGAAPDASWLPTPTGQFARRPSRRISMPHEAPVILKIQLTVQVEVNDIQQVKEEQLKHVHVRNVVDERGGSVEQLLFPPWENYVTQMICDRINGHIPLHQGGRAGPDGRARPCRSRG